MLPTYAGRGGLGTRLNVSNVHHITCANNVSVTGV